MSENESKNSELAILLKTAAEVEIIKERFDRHLIEIRDENKLVRADISNLRDALMAEKINVVEKHGVLNAKMAGMNGIITVIMYFITDFIHGIIKK